MSIRKALILDIDYPLSEKPELINNALRSVHTAVYWASTLSVSIKLSLSDSCLFMLGKGVVRRSHCHLEGLGSLSRSKVDGSRTVYSVDWRRGLIDVFLEVVFFAEFMHSQVSLSAPQFGYRPLLATATCPRM